MRVFGFWQGDQDEFIELRNAVFVPIFGVWRQFGPLTWRKAIFKFPRAGA